MQRTEVEILQDLAGVTTSLAKLQASLLASTKALEAARFNKLSYEKSIQDDCELLARLQRELVNLKK